MDKYSTLVHCMQYTTYIDPPKAEVIYNNASSINFAIKEIVLLVYRFFWCQNYTNTIVLPLECYFVWVGLQLVTTG